MDPNTALDLMREAQHEQRWEDADTHAADLYAWLSSGGFEPRDLTGAERAYLRRAYLSEQGWAA